MLKHVPILVLICMILRVLYLNVYAHILLAYKYDTCNAPCTGSHAYPCTGGHLILILILMPILLLLLLSRKLGLCMHVHVLHVYMGKYV